MARVALVSHNFLTVSKIPTTLLSISKALLAHESNFMLMELHRLGRVKYVFLKFPFNP